MHTTWSELARQYVALFQRARDTNCPLPMETNVTLTVADVSMEESGCKPCQQRYETVHVTGNITFADIGNIAVCDAYITPWYMLCKCPEPGLENLEDLAETNEPLFKGYLEGVRDCVYDRFLTKTPQFNSPLVSAHE